MKTFAYLALLTLVLAGSALAVPGNSSSSANNAGGLPACTAELAEADALAESLATENTQLQSRFDATDAALVQAEDALAPRLAYLDWLRTCNAESTQLEVQTVTTLVIQPDKSRTLVETSECVSGNGQVAPHVISTDLDFALGGGEICKCPPGEDTWAFCPVEDNCNCCATLGGGTGGD